MPPPPITPPSFLLHMNRNHIAGLWSPVGDMNEKIRAISLLRLTNFHFFENIFGHPLSDRSPENSLGETKVGKSYDNDLVT